MPIPNALCPPSLLDHPYSTLRCIKSAFLLALKDRLKHPCISSNYAIGIILPSIFNKHIHAYMLCTFQRKTKICHYLEGREKEGVGFTQIPTITKYGDMLYCDLVISKNKLIKLHYFLHFSYFFFGKLKSLINQNYMSTGASSKNKSNLEPSSNENTTAQH